MCWLGYSQQRDTVVTSTLYFKVNTTEFIQDENYQEFVNSQLPFIQEHQDDIKYIKITGTASPEGTYSGNRALAQGRVDAVRDILNLDDEITISEDYDGLYKLIEASNEPWKGKILKILSTSNDVKHDLIRSGYWKELNQKYFPRLRRIDIKVYFLYPQVIKEIERDTVVIKEVMKEIERDTIILTELKHDTIFIQKPIYFRDTILIRPNLKVIPILAVKTNLLSDLAITPNVQAELYTHLWGLSLEFDYTFPWWHKDYDSYFYYQLLNGIAGIRKYLNNKYTGHWIGVYANTAIYDFCAWNKDLGYQGEVYGCGLGYGYVFQCKKHPRWKFELYGRIGWFNTRFDAYHASQPWDTKYYYNWYLRASDFVPRRFNMNYFGPTEVGFNLTFDLICGRKLYWD
jgi:hypothetical protein